MNIILLKLSLSAAAGLFLGLEREAKHKPLGLKTCAVISIASCMLTIVSIESALDTHNGMSFIRSDPMRLSAQIVSGVGFLGAGVILRRSNDVISGLTTAAIVWAASGFGIAIGAGYYVEATVGMALIFVTVSFVPYIMRKIGPHSLTEQEIYLNVYVSTAVNLIQLVNDIEKTVEKVTNVKIKGDSGGHKVEMRCIVADGNNSLFVQYEKINQIHGVVRVEIAGI